MGLFQKNWNGSRHILQLLIINLVCWFFDIASAQVDAIAKAFDSLNFPMEAITCLVNLLVFGVILIRGRLDLENGAREVLATRRAPELEKINGINGMGLTTIPPQGRLQTISTIRTQRRLQTISTGGGGLQTVKTGSTEEGLQNACVVMLSNGTPNISMKQFMKYNAVDDVHSILLQFLLLKNAGVNVTSCISSECPCNCIVFSTVDEITRMLDRRMPGTLKRVSDSMCLLPCLTCLNNGCHGCNHGLLHIPEGLTEGDSRVESTDQLREILIEGDSESPAAVCQILDEIDVQSMNAGEPICICIPTHDAGDDKWTELLINSFMSKDAEARGVKVPASEALQEYLHKERGRPNRQEVLEFTSGSFIWPRFLEILINFALTFWFKVDGFSSSLVSRKTVRDHLVNSKGSGLAANAFLTEPIVQCNADNTHVCQVLTFRDNRLSFKTLSFIAGGANLICFIGWAVLIAFDCGDSAPPLCEARVVVIVVVIGIACFMDCLYMYSNWLFSRIKPDYKVLSVTISEIVCMVAGIVVTTVAKMVCGNRESEDRAAQLMWVYSALQLLVWVKWVIGSDILDQYSRESSGYKHDDWKVLVFSSAFLLNAALAGVRIKWSPTWPWKKNHLFTRFLPNISHHASPPSHPRC